MESDSIQEFVKASREAAADLALRGKIENATGRHGDSVVAAVAAFPPYDREKEAARAIKQDAIGRLDQLLLELRQKLQARNVKVFFAADAAEARDYILKVAGHIAARLVVKGKSMTTEEIELNPAFKDAGIEVLETDLGEYIVQLRGEKPSHIITPAIHLSKEDIGELFQNKLHVPYTAEPAELTAMARERLRESFLGADLGITGVNFAIAETGTLVLVENEGNGRMTSTMPDTFIALMGLEKVIPKLDDLPHFLEILARTATGQKLTTYTSFINGPRRFGELDGPREMHVVILDNGRSAMLADPVLREALYCLRCGACLNVCPVYARIGGHAYGSAYPGPIGSIVSPSLFGKSTYHLPFVSTLCGACKDICPVKIDIPRILLHLRAKASAESEPLQWPWAAETARKGARRFARIARHPWVTRILGRAVSLLLRPFARDGYIRRLPPPFNAWTKHRDFPLPHSRVKLTREAPPPTS